MTLGIHILDLPKYTVDAAITNNRREITQAAYSVLRTWMKAQHGREEAYSTLYNSMMENKWNMLAAELEKWSELD